MGRCVGRHQMLDVDYVDERGMKTHFYRYARLDVFASLQLGRRHSKRRTTVDLALFALLATGDVATTFRSRR